MNAAAVNTFRKSALASMAAIFPGTVTIAGRAFRAAVNLGPVLLSIPGEGAIERRGLTALVMKTDLREPPPDGATVIHDRREYIINSHSGREDHQIHWRLVCIEKERN